MVGIFTINNFAPFATLLYSFLCFYSYLFVFFVQFKFILNVRLDYRLTYLLSIFKKAYEHNYIREFNLTVNSTASEKKNFVKLVNEAEKIFRNEKDLTDLDLDGAGGKTFLRVLLKLIMHDYPPLVSGSLQLLFRHFSQIQETLSAFKQV